MKFFRNYNMISVPGWHMTAVTVNKETLTEAMGTGVYFLDGKCYFEPTDMTTALRAIWQENAENATEQEAQEAVCFTALNGQLQGKRILNVLGLLGHVKLFLNLSSTHAEGTERPDGFMVLAGAVLKRNEIPFEAYDKADWDGNYGILREDVLLPSASEAAKFVSGYKNISGPQYWKDRNGTCLKELREQSICFTCRKNIF